MTELKSVRLSHVSFTILKIANIFTGPQGLRISVTSATYARYKTKYKFIASKGHNFIRILRLLKVLEIEVE